MGTPLQLGEIPHRPRFLIFSKEGVEMKSRFHRLVRMLWHSSVVLGFTVLAANVWTGMDLFTKIVATVVFSLLAFENLVVVFMQGVDLFD